MASSSNMTLPGASLMVDGYLGGARTVISNQHHANLFSGPDRLAFLDEDVNANVENSSITNRTIQGSNILHKSTSQMKEYNTMYSGLTIIPWEDFVKKPTQLNDLFHLEKTGFITFDPDEVNIFFHATRMNKPLLGDVSENGKSWLVTVENIRELELVRASLMEKISIFGLTLVKKDKRTKKKQRAPCLLMLDPAHGNLGEQLHTHIMRCITVMQERGKFCLQIDFNGSVERWCRKVATTRCRSVGAKIVITNGDEADDFATVENILCCVVCFPIWAIQTALVKLHRSMAYKDFSVEFNAEEILLHGAVGGIQNQRRQLFTERTKSKVFYTAPTETPVEDQGHKYICIKKYDKTSEDESGRESRITQHETTSVHELFADQQEKIIRQIENEENPSAPKTKPKIKSHKPFVLTKQFEKKNSKRIDVLDSQNHVEASSGNLSVKKDISKIELPQQIEVMKLQSQENSSENKGKSVTIIKTESPPVSTRSGENTVVKSLSIKPGRYTRHDVNIEEDEDFDDNEIHSLQVKEPVNQTRLLKYEKAPQPERGINNAAYDSSDSIDSESQIEEIVKYEPKKVTSKQVPSSQSNGLDSDRNVSQHVPSNPAPLRMSDNKLPPIKRSLKEETPNTGQNDSGNSIVRKDDAQSVSSDEGGSFFKPNTELQERRKLAQLYEDINKVAGNTGVIPVSKTPRALEVDSTNTDEGDLDISDLESDKEGDIKTESVIKRTERSKSGTRRNHRYDSRRKYLGVHVPKRNFKTPAHKSDSLENAVDIIDSV